MDDALNVNCSTKKVKTYQIWLSETWLFFPHSLSLHFEEIDETNHEHWRTETPHTRSQVYALSNLNSCVQSALLFYAVALERSISC